MDTVKLYDPTYMSQKKLRTYGKNSESTYHENRMLVLRIIADNGPISRIQLAQRTKLKGATITIIIKDFLDKNIIEPAGKIKGDRGRSVMSFSLNNRFCSICVRITSTYIKVALYNINYVNLFIQKEFMNTSQDVCNTLDRIKDLISDALSLNSLILLGVSIGIEGRCYLQDNDYSLWDKKTGSYIMVGKYLHDSLDIPILVNRAINYAAYYTWHQLYKHKIGTILQINVGYTIECGIIINGEIMNGHNGRTGMIRGNYISIEDKTTVEQYIATPTILKEALALLHEFPESVIKCKQDCLNIRDIIHGFENDDPLCIRIFQDFSIRLANVIAPMVNLLAPSMVVAGDEIPVSERFEKMVRNALVPLIGEQNASIVQTWTHGVPRDSRNDPALLGGNMYLLHAAIDYANSPIYT